MISDYSDFRFLLPQLLEQHDFSSQFWFLFPVMLSRKISDFNISISDFNINFWFQYRFLTDIASYSDTHWHVQLLQVNSHCSVSSGTFSLMQCETSHHILCSEPSFLALQAYGNNSTQRLVLPHFLDREQRCLSFFKGLTEMCSQLLLVEYHRGRILVVQ